MTFPTPRVRPLLAAAILASQVSGAVGADATNAPVTASATNAPTVAATNAAAAVTATPAPAAAEAESKAAPVPDGKPAGAATNAPSGETPAAGATATNASRRPEFADFRLVGDRNIFNPNRSPRTSRRGSGGEPRPRRIETFSLVGVMSYDRGDLAFFDSAASAYRKSVRTNETIAGYRVAAVTPTEVRLELDGKTVKAPVGTRFRRADEEPWELVLPGGTMPAEPKAEVAAADGIKDAEVASDGGAGADKDKDKGTSGGGSGGAASDVLKRLLQKRQQEMKNEQQ